MHPHISGLPPVTLRHTTTFPTSLSTSPSPGWNVTHAASETGLGEMVGVLLRAGAPVDRKANDGTTPLMLAATCGDIEVVALLVGNGADWGASRDDGWTVLSLAIASGNGHVVDFLTQVWPGAWSV